MLEDRDRHEEIDSRHSLLRLEEFCKVYKQLFAEGEAAPPESACRQPVVLFHVSHQPAQPRHSS